MKGINVLSQTSGRNKAELYKMESDLRGVPISESTLIKSMAGYDRKLKAKAEKEFAEKIRFEKSKEGLYKPIRDVLSKDKRALDSYKAALKASLSKRRKILLPSAPEETAHVYLGSLGGKAVAPFGYARTWAWKKGKASFPELLSADKKKGSLEIKLGYNNFGYYAGKSRAAIGMYFRPATENGILRVRSNISYNAFWETVCNHYTAEVEGWVGFKIERYNYSSKQYVDTILKQRKILFKDSSWWEGIGFDEESNTGYGLKAEVDVDSAHFYIIWIRCGARVQSDYSGYFSSAAISELKIKVPSISWELFGS